MDIMGNYKVNCIYGLYIQTFWDMYICAKRK